MKNKYLHFCFTINNYGRAKCLKTVWQIKVKTGNNDGFDFHSFRKNLSIALQDSGVGATYINDIIGWEGKTTMEQSYSNHTLAQIKAEMHKFSYNFLKPHFAKWKTIMAKK